MQWYLIWIVFPFERSFHLIQVLTSRYKEVFHISYSMYLWPKLQSWNSCYTCISNFLNVSPLGLVPHKFPPSVGRFWGHQFLGLTYLNTTSICCESIIAEMSNFQLFSLVPIQYYCEFLLAASKKGNMEWQKKYKTHSQRRSVM